MSTNSYNEPIPTLSDVLEAAFNSLLGSDDIWQAYNERQQENDPKSSERQSFWD